MSLEPTATLAHRHQRVTGKPSISTEDLRRLGFVREPFPGLCVHHHGPLSLCPRAHPLQLFSTAARLGSCAAGRQIPQQQVVLLCSRNIQGKLCNRRSPPGQKPVSGWLSVARRCFYRQAFAGHSQTDHNLIASVTAPLLGSLCPLRGAMRADEGEGRGEGTAVSSPLRIPCVSCCIRGLAAVLGLATCCSAPNVRRRR